MSETNGTAPRFDGALYMRNRIRLFPPETLIPYEGQVIAFTLDGTRLLASAPDLPDLRAVLAGMGVAPHECVVSYHPEAE